MYIAYLYLKYTYRCFEICNIEQLTVKGAAWLVQMFRKQGIISSYIQVNNQEDIILLKNTDVQISARDYRGRHYKFHLSRKTLYFSSKKKEDIVIFSFHFGYSSAFY